MIQAIRKEGTRLVLEYNSDQPDNSWVHHKLDGGGTASFRKTFHFTKKSLIRGGQKIQIYDDSLQFELGVLEGEYYKIKKDVLDIRFDVFLHQDLPINLKFFCAATNVSIFKKLNELIVENLYVGGPRTDTIPIKVFYNLIRNFPNEYEVKKYVEARISAIINNYVDTVKDAESSFAKYMNKKEGRVGEKILESIREYELSKYEALLQKLKTMLQDENSYTEAQWQKEILEIIRLIHPKYIKVFEKVTIKDSYNNKKRELDFLLVDASGNVDITEIKKPFGKCIITERTYRDNHIPLKELSGTVVQIEKYIFYMNKWGKNGEETLTQKYRDALPVGFSIKIINPKALIIMGRDHSLSASQRNDFEVIKRQYKNVIDIITYDDLLARLEFMIKQLQVA
jgi:hypothetical protein